MSELYNQFLEDADKNAFNPEYRKRIKYNISKYDESVVRGKQQYHDLDLAKDRAASGLDLNKNQTAALLGDQINFSVAAAIVPSQDPVTGLFQMFSR